MSTDNIITINGQRYDAVTGLPIAKKPSTPTKRLTQAADIHAAPQRSKTLVRRSTKKPVAHPVMPRRTPGKSMDFAPRSNNITKFAAHPKPSPVVTSTPDIPAIAHPVVAKAHKQHAARTAPVAPTAPASSKAIKEEAIVQALAKPAVKHKRKNFFQRHPRLLSIGSISIVVAVLAGYLTYTNIPSISVKVAATQAGIDATYPEYRPDGYSLDGPVTFSDGQVTINFASNSGTSKFAIKQAKSSWDSTAVLDNIVRAKVGEKYITSQERGLTIYTFGGNAAWVNGGILYTIDGNAPLSGEQIRRIATSL